MADTPSTAPTPLDESLKKFLGGEGASQLLPNQVAYGSDLSYNPSDQFRPKGDVLTINAAPGTGASTAETWSHELDVERQRQDALEFEFQQRTTAEENARKLAELEMSKAEAGRAAALAPYELQSARTANRAAAYELPVKQMAAVNAQRQMEMDRAQQQAGAAVWEQNMRTPGFTFSSWGGPWQTVMPGGKLTSDPKYGRVSQQINPATGNFYQNQNRLQLLTNQNNAGW